MRHRRREKHFGRKSTARKALFRGLMVSLVEHGRIKTTVDKAKELRRHIEKAITIGKKANLSARRLLLSRVANETAVDSIVTDLSKRFQTRAGGYTRIIKIGRRPGDAAEMAFIEFVDYDFKSKIDAKSDAKKDAKETKAAKETKKVELKAKSKIVKASARAKLAKKKSRAKMQKASRVESRA